MTDDLIPIGRFARAARLSLKALRLYDENGLLPPLRVDAETGYRYYAWSQVRTARRIALLREAGMPLAEIGRFLAEPRPEALDAYRALLDAEHVRRVEVLDFVRATTEEEPMYEVSMKQVDEQRFVGRTADVPPEEVEEFLISTLRKLAGKHEPAGWPFSIYHGLAPDAEGDEEGIGPVEVGLPTPDGDRVLAAARGRLHGGSGERPLPVSADRRCLRRDLELGQGASAGARRAAA
jgi:DNA-binding transcriptional MerR regulator